MSAMEEKAPEPHFLVATFPAQGHINPVRHLALRLLRSTGVRVTVSTAVSAYRKMFPDAADECEHRDGAGVCYVPYSDGYDDGFDRAAAARDPTRYLSQFKLVGSRTLGAVLARLRAAGRPVTLVVYTFMLPWVADVARDHGVPAALYWIQPVTVLAAYLNFFRGTDGVDRDITAAAGDPWAAVRIPGLPPLRVRDLPSFLTITSDEDPYAFMLTVVRDLIIDALGREGRPTVLANTFDNMEPDAVASLRQHGLDIIPVGPVLSFLDAAADNNGSAPAPSNNDLFKQDGKGYLEWLDARPVGSVVYISFGSMSVMSKRQIAEVASGMAENGRPFLWVLRKDNRGEDDGNVCDGGEHGMVVEWCDQVKVLSHPAACRGVLRDALRVELDAGECGVPVVGVPQWTDQGTNAWLVEQLGTGVRAAVSDKDGVLEADELRRCLDFATSEMVRAKAALWREKARAAVAEGGSSERNLREFVEQVAGGY